MPPKRGRGRGGAAAGASGRNASQPDSSASANPTPANINTQNVNVESQVSPNNSPADAPTETPAPTPARAPVQRLDSLGGGVGGTRGSARGARAGASTSRFKPKAVRRGVEEREKAAKEELERQAAKDKDANALARREGRGRGRGDARGRGGRGRGDAMGRGRAMGTGGASGPFSAAPSGPDRKQGLFAPGSGPKREGGGFGGSVHVGGSSGTKIKTEGGMSHYSGGGGGGGGGSSGRVKDEFREPVYPDEQEDGDNVAPKIDIEHINLVSDDENGGGGNGHGGSRRNKGKGSSNKEGLRPVRLARREHKERVTMVNTEPAATPVAVAKEATTEEDSGEVGGMFVEGDEDAEAERRAALERMRDDDVRNFSGVWGNVGDDDTPQIKYDPDEPPKESIMLAETMDIDSKATTPAPATSIDSKMAPESQIPVSPETKSKVKRRKSSNRDKKPVLQTEEDKAEYARHLEDVQILAEELGGLQTATQSGHTDTDGDTDMETKNKEGRLYLFQFPPILPPLYNPVKKEEATNNDVEMSGVPLTAPNGTENATDLTKPDNEQEEVIIKPDPGDSVAPTNLIPEAGFVGKLVVRQSGKVELSWGGTSLQLNKGANFDFLTTTMLVEDESLDKTGNGEKKGRGIGMGRVMGKFVATPDWSALFEGQR